MSLTSSDQCIVCNSIVCAKTWGLYVYIYYIIIIVLTSILHTSMGHYNMS